MKLWQAVKDDFIHDYNWNRVARLTTRGAQALPEASLQYGLDKFPIIGWLPRYDKRWIINDVIAGLTLGLMLIPQGLSYAKIATIPVQYGLMSSWLPATIYAFMGTTKDLSTGPTSLIGLLTSEIIEELHSEHAPSEIASAVALMMGVYGMVLGFLKLGFILEFISLPILSGFISAVAITIVLNQMGSLLGETGIGSGTAQQIHDIFSKLPDASGYDCAIGFTGILFLTILDQAGKRWSKKSKVIWFLSITRAFLCLVLYTGISYAVNHTRGKPSNYLFAVVQVKANGLERPRIPSSDLISKVASRSIAVFIGAAVEHTAIARAFGVRNKYVTDQSQELCYFGITNFFNSFFHSMGVGGAMSRTAVNSACRVKSPLSGLVTTAIVLISIFKLVGTLYWVPKATLAAIIITAVWPLISSPQTFYKYWKTSLADWTSSMIAFWVSLFVSTEIGIGASVGFNIVYCLLRQIFTRISSFGNDTRSELVMSIDDARDTPRHIPDSVHVFKFNDSFFFPNSYSLKTAVMDDIQTFHAPAYSSDNGSEAERNWSVVGEKRIAKLRKKAGVRDVSTLPGLKVVVLDFSRVNHIDATAVSHMANMMNEIRKYAGAEAEVRVTGMTEYVKRRFERAGWKVIDLTNTNRFGDGSTADSETSEELDGNAIGSNQKQTGDESKTLRLYRTVREAVSAPTRFEIERTREVFDGEKLKVTFSHDEGV